MAGNTRLMFSTLGCPQWSLEKAAGAAVHYGYGGLELRLLDGALIPAVLDEDRKARIRTVMQTHDLRLIGLGASTRFTAPQPEERAQHEAELAAYIALAADLDVPFVRTFGGNVPAGGTMSESIEWVSQSLSRVAPVAADAGITILLETHDAFCKGRDVAAVLDRVASPQVQAVWDVHHPYRMGESVEETWQCIGERTAHVHLKDARHRADGSFELVLMGEGDVPNRRIIEMLEARGYAGCYSAEWEKAWHPDIPEPEVALPQHADTILGWLS